MGCGPLLHPFRKGRPAWLVTVQIRPAPLPPLLRKGTLPSAPRWRGLAPHPVGAVPHPAPLSSIDRSNRLPGPRRIGATAERAKVVTIALTRIFLRRNSEILSRPAAI